MKNKRLLTIFLLASVFLVSYLYVLNGKSDAKDSIVFDNIPETVEIYKELRTGEKSIKFTLSDIMDSEAVIYEDKNGTKVLLESEKISDDRIKVTPKLITKDFTVEFTSEILEDGLKIEKIYDANTYSKGSTDIKCSVTDEKSNENFSSAKVEFSMNDQVGKTIDGYLYFENSNTDKLKIAWNFSD